MTQPKQKEAPATPEAVEAPQPEGPTDRDDSTTEGQNGQTGWTVPTDPAERNRLINQGICPVCGGNWRGGPEGHGDNCPNARPAKHNGAGRNWRQGRGRQRYSSRASRWHPLDMVPVGGR